MGHGARHPEVPTDVVPRSRRETGARPGTEVGAHRRRRSRFGGSSEETHGKAEAAGLQTPYLEMTLGSAS